jgi:hypothetical protein
MQQDKAGAGSPAAPHTPAAGLIPAFRRLEPLPSLKAGSQAAASETSSGVPPLAQVRALRRQQAQQHSEAGG